jgi:hypothetical protein
LSGRRSGKPVVDRRHEADQTACLEALKLLLNDSVRRSNNGSERSDKESGMAHVHNRDKPPSLLSEE